MDERSSIYELSKFLVGDSSFQDTLQRVVTLANDTIEPAMMTGITMLVDERPTTAFFSDPAVTAIDAAQYEENNGPCLDAFRSGAMVTIRSMRTEERWPAFVDVALRHGIHSTMSIPMVAGGERTGALNFYATVAHAFDAEHERRAQEFATHAAVVLANAQAYWTAFDLAQGLREAMTSRATIEQAKGVLMAQSSVPEEVAFDILRRASQRENRKLRDVAADVVDRVVGDSPRRPGADEPD